MTTTELLSDYDIGFPTILKLHTGALYSNSGNVGQSSRNNKFKSGSGGNGLTLQTPISSSSSCCFNSGGKLKTLSYFLFHGPYKVVECLQKFVLNAIKAKLQEKAQGGDKGDKEDSTKED